MDRRTYFDELSSRWDTFTDAGKVQRALTAALQGYALLPHEHVIDLGCGTGNLSHVLCSFLGPEGRITAIDLSPEMIAVARARLRDPRVDWLTADAATLPLPSAHADRVICFSAWPHFSRPDVVACELARVLRPGGMLHVLHIDSKEKINAIHTGVGGAIGHDLLLPASDLAQLLRDVRFELCEEIDDADAYRVSARWPG